MIKKFFRRGEGGNGEPMRAQETRERFANGRVVVYKKYGGAWGNSHQWLSAILLRLTSAGNTKVKRRAALSIVPDTDVAPVGLNDSAADGYPKPHSVGFCCKERLEHSLHCFLRNTATPVSDRYMHRAVFLSRSDKQLALRGIEVNHRFAAI